MKRFCLFLLLFAAVSYAQVPYDVSREIRDLSPYSAIVDRDGHGDFWQIQDAIDAGHKSIFVRDGTYDAFDIDQADVVVVGESWDVIVDGGITAHAVAITAANVSVRNLTAQTTAGGGQAYDGVNVSAAGTDAELVHVNAPASDNRGVQLSARACICECKITSADVDGITLNATADDSRIVNNYILSNGGWGTAENAAAENCIYVANRVTGNGSGQIQQASGTGTYVGNDET